MPLKRAAVRARRTLLRPASAHAVQIRIADEAEFHKRIGIELLGQRVCRELVEFDLRLSQRALAVKRVELQTTSRS